MRMMIILESDAGILRKAKVSIRHPLPRSQASQKRREIRLASILSAKCVGAWEESASLFSSRRLEKIAINQQGNNNNKNSNTPYFKWRIIET